LTAADIIEADDWLIEQPCPPMRTSRTTSPGAGRHRQLAPVPGVAVVVEDDLPVEVFETGHGQVILL
jgi:hypothetical protein